MKRKVGLRRVKKKRRYRTAPTIRGAMREKKQAGSIAPNLTKLRTKNQGSRELPKECSKQTLQGQNVQKIGKQKREEQVRKSPINQERNLSAL